ncbi:MAG TPA: hypothetical protein VFH78_14660 [Candidatus Thermoplasmatota archaeon]|nr:hypothetical protein [Candidatus Thermoplasmatota archaeon]
MELVYLAGALAGGAALAGAAVWAAWRYTRAAPSPAPSPAPAAKEVPVKLEIVEEDEHPASFVPARPAPAAAPAARPRAAPARPVLAPPPPGIVPPRAHAARAPAMVLTPGIQMHDEPPAALARAPPRAAPPVAAPRPPMREPPPMKSWAQQVMEHAPAEVPTEWARRQVGVVEPGRTAGACGGCGARLSVSNARPLRIACPVCGRTKLLAS